MKTFAGFTEKIPENGDYRPDAMTEKECNDKGKKTQQQSSTIHVHDTCITICFRNQKGAGAEMPPAIVSGIVTGNAPVSYWPIFFPVPSNCPRSLCEG